MSERPKIRLVEPGRRPPAKASVDANSVKVLEEALALARTGRLHAIGLAWVDAQDGTMHNDWAYKGGLMTDLLLSIVLLQDDLKDHARDLE